MKVIMRPLSMGRSPTAACDQVISRQDRDHNNSRTTAEMPENDWSEAPIGQNAFMLKCILDEANFRVPSALTAAAILRIKTREIRNKWPNQEFAYACN